MPWLTCFGELTVAVVNSDDDAGIDGTHSLHCGGNVCNFERGPQLVATGALDVTHTGAACMLERTLWQLNALTAATCTRACKALLSQPLSSPAI